MIATSASRDIVMVCVVAILFAAIAAVAGAVHEYSVASALAN